jgi:Tfp pilus assembly protein PilV
MHTFFAMLLRRRPGRRGRQHALHRAARARTRASRAPRFPRPASEEGFLMVEVLISSLLVALIVFATFNGFDVVNRVSADQRQHDQAALLAAQSQEQMRSDPATSLESLQLASHTYSQTVGGTTFKITQSAKFINDSKQAAECSALAAAESSSKQNSSYLQITSSVTWPRLEAVGRPAVVQSSLITPPTGSGLEVDAVNGASPEAGVANVTAVTKYTSEEATEATTVEGTTGMAGCVVFGAIPATVAKLEVKPPPGYITPAGAFKLQPEEVTIAPNITTHKSYTLNEGGAIAAQFTYKGATSAEITGDTFVAFNTSMITTPQLILGDTAFSYESTGEQHYTGLLSTAASNKYATAAATPSTIGYPHGDLFPFPAAKKWLVFAGDCFKNNPTETANPESLKPSEAVVQPGKTTVVQIALSKVTLNVYTGTHLSPGALYAEPTKLPTSLTNTSCEGSGTPNNAAGLNLIHEQNTLSGGHLESPYQPFGNFTLCLYSAKEKKNYTLNIKNEKQENTAHTIYLADGNFGEQTVTPTPVKPC